MTSREDTLKRVKQLLALAEGNDNVHEAAAAMGRAQRYLQDHNLSMAEVDSLDTEEDEAIENCGDLFGGDSQKLSEWKKQLAMSVCKANSCFIYTASRWDEKKYRNVRVAKIIGRPSDVQIAQYIFDAMAREIDRLCKKANNGFGRTWANNYRLGAVAAIRQRIDEEKKEAEKAASHGAIVKVEERYASVERWAYSPAAGLHLRKVSAGQHRRDADAYGKGFRAGKNVHARSGLGGGSSTKKLLG